MLLLFGASMAHGFMPGGKIFPMRATLEAMYDHGVTEEGVGGQKASAMVGRLQGTLDKSENARRATAFEYVVLWTGMNDVLDPTSSADSITMALIALVKICEAGRAVRLCTLHATVLEDKDGTGVLKKKREEVNERMKGMSNVVILDFANANLELGSDGLHLSKQGYMHACKIIAESVKK